MAKGERVIRIPALFGGISQQPASVRHSNQVEDAINAVFSVADGVSKRPGSNYVAQATGLTNGGDYRVHEIVRDHQERYLVIYGEGDLKVFELLDDGTALEATVNLTTDASNYIAANSASSGDLRLVTIADYTIIVNTTVSTSGDNGNGTIDETTMPVQMVRTSYPGDGSTPAVFDVDTIDWKDRPSGDSTTNPLPSIIKAGRKIADVSFHRNRLVLAGGENIVFSQAGAFFNLWIQDANNIVDSDPIDVALSSEQVTLVDYVVPFRKSLVIFTKAGRQFELNAPETLTPTTAAITPSTSYRTKSIRPQPLSNFLYFAGERRDASVMYEYFYDDSRVSNTAADITGHVQGLLPSDLRSIRTSTNNQMVFALGTDCSDFYVYKTFWNGSEKVQSAWGRWVFDLSYRINDFGVVRNDLYLLVESESQFIIESVPITRQVIS